MTPDQLASLAASLNDNEVFQLSLERARTQALDALATVNATDADTIREHQATVRVIDTIRDDIAAFIRGGATRNPPGIA